MNEIGGGSHGDFRIEPGGQRFVIDFDQRERTLGRGFVEGGDTSDVVADVADFVDGEGVLVVPDGEDAVGGGGVGPGDDGDDSVERTGASGVDVLDARVGQGGVQDLADQHAGELEVVGILAGAAGLGGGVDHGDGVADDGVIAHDCSRR